MKPLLHWFLLYEYFGGFGALAADVEAVSGVLYADALEVVVFDGFVGIEVDVFDCADFVKTYSEREDVDAVGRCLEGCRCGVGSSEPEGVLSFVEGYAVFSEGVEFDTDERDVFEDIALGSFDYD